MRVNKMFLDVSLRTTSTILALLFAAGSLSFTGASGTVRAAGRPAALVAARDDESGAVHRPLATVGITPGQTARINVVNSPDPGSVDPPAPITVEMCFHDRNGDLILDRSRRPVQKTATIDPHHGDFLDLNGNLVAGTGGRVVIIPCFRILRADRGTLAVPTLEMFNNLLKTSFVLNPGTARGFDPQPDPPVLPEVAFGLVGITQGVSARLYVVNAQNPNSLSPPDPVTVELTLHDANDNVFIDRSGHPTQRILTIGPNQADFLELNGNDIAAFGGRVGIIPCVKVLRGSRTSLVAPTLEVYINLTQQTLLLSGFSSLPDQLIPSSPAR